jgi:hypothetical protein
MNRWLLLDQETDRDLWTKDRTCRCLIWNQRGKTVRPTYPAGEPEEKEICILFLPESHEDLPPLPDLYFNIIPWQWNVWCHYGRDITMAELKSRWQSYDRLSSADKSRLSRDNSRPPIPFSRSMRQPWSDETMVRLPNQGNIFDCLKRLKHAWDLAEGSQGAQEFVEQGREAMPAVLAAHYVLDSLPVLAGWDNGARIETIDKALSLCQQSGLMALASRKERFSKPVCNAYRHLGFTVFRLRSLQRLLKQGLTLPVSAGELGSLRTALHSFLAVAKAEADRTTELLTQSP